MELQLPAVKCAQIFPQAFQKCYLIDLKTFLMSPLVFLFSVF